MTFGSDSTRLVAAVALVAAATLGGYHWGRPCLAMPAGNASRVCAPAAGVGEGEVEVVTTAPTADGPALGEVPRLRFPNGTSAAALNHVAAPAPCVWGDFQWSPIVRIDRNNGLDWYVHADGTYTTTTMTWRSDLGRDEPVTLCVHPRVPGPSPPVKANRSGDAR